MPISTRLGRCVAGALLAVVAIAGVVASAQARQGNAVVDLVEVRGTIDPPTAALIRQAIESAARNGSTAVVLDIDADAVVSVDLALITPIVESTVPVVVWIGSDATARGGSAFVAVAADVLVMAPDAELGPAVPFQLEDGDPGSADPAREGLTDYTNLRRTLDVPNGDPRTLAAELATTSLNGAEAVARGIADATVASRDEAIAALVPDVGQIRPHTFTLAQKLLRRSADPTTTFLLFVLVVTGVLLLPWRSGTAVTLLGVLGPFMVFGMQVTPAAWWAATLVVIGLVLVAFDAGLLWVGAPTVLGIAMLGVGGWQFTTGPGSLEVQPTAIAAIVVAAALVSWLGYRRQIATVLERLREDQAPPLAEPPTG